MSENAALAAQMGEVATMELLKWSVFTVLLHTTLCAQQQPKAFYFKNDLSHPVVLRVKTKDGHLLTKDPTKTSEELLIVQPGATTSLTYRFAFVGGTVRARIWLVDQKLKTEQNSISAFYFDLADHQLFSLNKNNLYPRGAALLKEIEEQEDCPICLEELKQLVQDGVALHWLSSCCKKFICAQELTDWLVRVKSEANCPSCLASLEVLLQAYAQDELQGLAKKLGAQIRISSLKQSERDALLQRYKQVQQELMRRAGIKP